MQGWLIVPACPIQGAHSGGGAWTHVQSPGQHRVADRTIPKGAVSCCTMCRVCGVGMSVLPDTIKHMSEICALSVTDDQPATCPDGPGPAAADPRGNGPGGAGPGGMPDPEAALVPLGRLEERICELAGHLAAGTCRFLRLVAEFDARRGWACWDLPSCAAWLAWKCQVAPGTAREQVRVARALAGLPVITAEFAAGRMSYAKARALTRIATPATEAGLAEVTGPMTAAQCERFAAAHRTASDAAELASRASQPPPRRASPRKRPVTGRPVPARPPAPPVGHPGTPRTRRAATSTTARPSAPPPPSPSPAAPR
jgi:Domain of unknown function (DUF222)